MSRFTSSTRKKKGHTAFAVNYDRCPICKTQLREKKFTILWRDVLECKNCGHVWVTQLPLHAVELA